MTGRSEREYAAHSRLSRGKVQKERKNGRLVVHDDGSIKAATGRAVGQNDLPRSAAPVSGRRKACQWAGETSSDIKARALLTVHVERNKQTEVQKKKGTLVDRARARPSSFAWRGRNGISASLGPDGWLCAVAAQIMAGVERQ